MKRLVILAALVPALAVAAWDGKFKGNIRATASEQLSLAGLPPEVAEKVAQCMVDRAEKEVPDQKKFEEILQDEVQNSRLATRILRECLDQVP